MASDPKHVVSTGYDRIARAYLERHGSSAVRDLWLSVLAGFLPAEGGARVLDLGCGAGIPVSRKLADMGHHVIGLDGSERQIALARINAPAAEFLHVDMTKADFPTGRFDAVTAFYSITHVPRSEHDRLLRRIVRWLKPDGLFVASLGADSASDWRGEWMGTEMFFSHYDADTNLSLLREAGFAVERGEVMKQDDEDARFLWVAARAAPVE